MKKTIFTSNCMVAVATIILFTACNKEVVHPLSNSGSSYLATPAAQIVNATAAVKKPVGYIGSSTIGDSTKAATNP